MNNQLALADIPEQGSELFEQMMDFTSDFDLSLIDFSVCDEDELDFQSADDLFNGVFNANKPDAQKSAYALTADQKQSFGSAAKVAAEMFDSKDTSKKKQIREPVVNAEDFEDDGERQAVLLIQKYADVFFSKNPSNNTVQRLEALRFLFDPLFVLSTGYDLSLCCRAIHASIRLDVVQLRFQYEFWRNQIVFNNPFPFDTGDLSSMIENSAFIFANEAGIDGELGISIASRVWMQPGVSIANIVESALRVHPKLSKKDVFQCVRNLEDEYFLSCYFDHWYVTGVNPIRKAEFEVTQGISFRPDARLNWSTRFGRSDARLLFAG